MANQDRRQQKMPNHIVYLVLTLLCCVFGLVWGIIDAIQYMTLKDAVDHGDVALARTKARNILIISAIALASNIAILFIYPLLMNR